MIIKSVRLKDFISHADTRIDFPLGVTALTGPNGAGKTSIIDGILFALFAERVRGDRITDIIRRGTNSAEVEVVFEEGGREYTLRRVRKSKGMEVVLMRDGQPVATGQSEVLSEISRILRMDKDTAINSIFVRQGDITSLVDAEPRQRKILIGKLVGLDRLENAWQNMREVLDHFEEKAKEYDVVKREIEIRRERREQLLAEIKQLEEEAGKIRLGLEKHEKELENSSAELDAWRKKREDYYRLSERISTLKEQINSINRDVERLERELEEAENAKQEMLKIGPEIDKISVLEDYLRAAGEKEKIEERIKQVEKELERVENLLSEIEQTKQAYEKYVKLNDELKRLRERLDSLRHAEKEYEGVKTEIRMLQSRIDSIKSEMSEIELKALDVLPAATVEAKKARLEELDSRIAELDQKLSLLQNEYGQVKGRISEIDEYVKILGESTECPVCKSQLTPDHRDKVRTDFEAEKKWLQERLVEINAEVKSIGEEKRKLREERDRVNALNLDRIEKLKEELNGLEAKLGELLKREEKIRSDIESLAKVKDEVAELEVELEVVREDYERHLAASKALEKERSRDEIEAELSDLKTRLEEINGSISSLLSKLGYTPEKPEDELKRLRSLKERYEVLRSKAEKIDAIKKELNEARRNLEKTTIEKVSAEKELAGLEYSDEEYRKVEERYSSLDRKVAELRTKLEEVKRQKRSRTEELSKTDESIRDLEDKLKSLEKILEFVGKLQRIRQAFSKDGVQKIVRQRVAPIISEFARGYMENFNLDITDISVNEDFDVTIMKHGGEISIKSISGGEKVAVAIALRLAIAKALAGRISTIIMDEPTTHLDEERRRELVEIMKNFFREGSTVPQMIIITHHRELEDIADTVYRVEKVDGVSRVIEVC
ncbi:ATPase involved in DNA repair [Archaeoglobus fulgidus DSM 8774]|uniref:DNA double-strand break repair Rad50 ATPase n=1 Tax=Archaeoglobus fulgidus DSM 8774 TaxID=1344584 RepID=A0A075WIK1_ARCFL|nr:AAA family ATPase [Archaeoglobus fulgidus]AIG97418.1 ATPase involved in DNA repair [Archaeoglobus fulgidus DSM 8774]